MSVPPDPIELALKLRRDLDALDAVAIRRALLIYGRARRRIEEQIEELLAALGDPAAPVPSNALSLATRAELLTQIEVTLTRAGVQIEPALVEARREAVRLALDAAQQMSQAQGFDIKDRIDLARSWTRLDEQAVKELVETTADGTPLNRWLRELGPETRAAVEETIERAVTEHANVGDLAKELSKETGMAERKALMTTRESTFGVQRRAADQTYRANNHLLKGKMRIERTDGKTCRSCLALHGTIYPVEATMPGHVGCRRVEAPVLRSGRGLQDVQSGEDWLAAQPGAVQRAVLGGQPGYDAWQAGEAELIDFTETYQTEWGPQTRMVGAERAKANARRRVAGDRRAAD